MNKKILANVYIFILVGSIYGGIQKISFLGPPEVGEKLWPYMMAHANRMTKFVAV